MASSLSNEVQFNKLVYEFAHELNASERQKLVYIYKLTPSNPSYYNENPVAVFEGLKMIGTFGFDNQEGLLDIAEVLERNDLTRKYKRLLQERDKKLRRASSAVSLEQMYKKVDLVPSLDIAVRQIELGRDSSDLLRKICTHQKPTKTRRLSDHFESAMLKLDEAKKMLLEVHQLMSDSPENTPLPLKKSRPVEETQVCSVLSTDHEVTVVPQEESYETPLYENVGQQYSTAEQHRWRKPESVLQSGQAGGSSPSHTPPPVSKKPASKAAPPTPVKPVKPSTTKPATTEHSSHTKVPILPPNITESFLQRKLSIQTPPNKPSPPLPLRPKPQRTTTTPTAASSTNDELYDLPLVPTHSSGAANNRNSSTFSDSGFSGEWPLPQTRERYQSLQQISEESSEYAQPADNWSS